MATITREQLAAVLAEVSIEDIAAAMPPLTEETQQWALGTYTLPANGKRPAVTKSGVYVNLGSSYKEQYLPQSPAALLIIARQALHAATVIPADAATATSARQRATSAEAIAALLASIKAQNEAAAKVAPVAPVTGKVGL